MPDRGPIIVALIAFAAALFMPTPGVTWDEPTYLTQGMQYVDWVARAVRGDAGAADLVWTAARPDHPPLAKVFYGLAAAARPRNVSALVGARLAAAFFFAALIGLTAYVASRSCGPLAGWLAGVSLLLTPQVLGHAQLVALDLPVTLAWMLVAAALLLGPTGRRGAFVIGVLWGVALLTKVNAIFLAAPIVVWSLAAKRLRWFHLALVGAVAAFTFWAGWPFLWQDTLPHLQAYLADKQVRWIVPTFYLAHVYNDAYPPWHYPLVLTVATLPLALLAGVAIGGASLVRTRPPVAWWIALNLLFTLGLASLPGVPRYDGTRLFLPAYPFLAIVAGVGFARLFDKLVSVGRLGTRGAITVIAVAGVATIVEVGALAPCLLSSYSPLVGGLKGAEHLGFETTYWGDAVTPELLAAIPAGARVGASPMGIDYVRAAQDAGMLRRDAVPAPEDRCDVLIVLARKGMLSDEFRTRFDSGRVLAETRRGGVALAKLVSGE